jgi:hypothetical protein
MMQLRNDLHVMCDKSDKPHSEDERVEKDASALEERR